MSGTAPGAGLSRASVWYQMTETVPASPAAIHGQNTLVPGWEMVIGADHVFPRSLVEIIMIEFGAGVLMFEPTVPRVLGQPPLVFGWRLSGSQTTSTVPAEAVA